MIECHVLLLSSSVDTMTAARIRVQFSEVTAEPRMAHEEPRKVVATPKFPKSPLIP